MNGVIQLLKNLRYLTKFSLKDRVINAPRVLSYEDMFMDALYKIQYNELIKPKIFNNIETIDVLLNSNYSIARFGDGELAIMRGENIPFQKYEKKLADRMKEIILAEQENLLIGINYHYFYSKWRQNAISLNNEFNFYVVPKCRKETLALIDINKQYYSAAITTSRSDEYFNKVRRLWEGKNILPVGCKELYNNMKFNVFDNAKSSDWLYIPNKDAFSSYNEILKDIQKHPKDTLIVLMAGPCAKVLASDLTYLGYRALDMGHIAKSYDFHKKQIEYTSENMTKFWAPDE